MAEITVRRAPAKADVTVYEIKRDEDLNPLGWVYRLDRFDWVGLRWRDQALSEHFRSRATAVLWLAEKG